MGFRGKGYIMNAQDVMQCHEIWACVETADAQSVAQMMEQHQVGAIPILDSDGRLEGIVTDRDLCCKVIAWGKSLNTPVRQIMSEPVYSILPETSLREAEAIMRDHRIHRLPVVDVDNKLKGFISISDIAHHCANSEEEHELVGVLESISEPYYKT